MLFKIKIPKSSKTVILLFAAHYKHRNRINKLFSILYYLITLLHLLPILSPVSSLVSPGSKQYVERQPPGLPII